MITVRNNMAEYFKMIEETAPQEKRKSFAIENAFKPISEKLYKTENANDGKSNDDFGQKFNETTGFGNKDNPFNK